MRKLLSFYNKYADLPHTSKYHFESYYEHCMLVIAQALDTGANRPVLLAAALHDIAKPRTQAINKVGGACFYDHEKVTEDEVAEFLPKNDADFGQVVALIQCHMLPYQVNSPGKWGEKARAELVQAISRFGEVYEDFEKNLNMLHQCDEAGSIRSAEAMEGIGPKIAKAEQWLSANF